MTVAVAVAKAGPYPGNDSASSFAFGFKVFADTDIRVVETLISTGAETDLTLNTHYTVALNLDQDNDPGGSITYKVGGVATALPSTKKLTIVSAFKFEQPTDIPNGGRFLAQIVENALDRVTALAKQLKVDVDRAVKVDVSSGTDPDDLLDEIAADVVAAATSATAAQTAQTNAQTAQTNAETAQGLAEAAQAAAEAAQAAAQAAAGATMWNDVSFKTAADSPITVNLSDYGKMFAVDCTAGAVTINLPTIAGLDLSLPWVVGIKKTDASANAITVARGGTDTIDGGTSKSIGSAGAAVVFIPDTDTSPDEWTTAEFGAVAGNLTDETFTAGVEFTAGSSTTLTLSKGYGSEPNITVHFDAAFQGADTYSLSGLTLTFSSAIPVGVSKVYVKGGTTLSIGTPADSTVSTVKLVDEAVTSAKIEDTLLAGINDFRLTLTSGLPVTTADVTASNTVYCTPYVGRRIAIFDGTRWNLHTSAEISLALSGLTSGKPYDVFCYNNAGTPTLELLVWTNDTTRATALTYQDGVLVASGAATRRYLGTFYTTSATTTEDSAANRYLYNYYNRVRRSMVRKESTASWTYTTAAWRQANGSTSNQLNFIQGVAEDSVSARVLAQYYNGSASHFSVGVGLDSTTTPSGLNGQIYEQTGTGTIGTADYEGIPAAGRHYLAWLEISQASGTGTWFGATSSTTGGSLPAQSGIEGGVMG